MMIKKTINMLLTILTSVIISVVFIVAVLFVLSLFNAKSTVDFPALYSSVDYIEGNLISYNPASRGKVDKVIINERQKINIVLDFLKDKTSNMKAAEKPLFSGTHAIILHLYGGEKITYLIDGGYIRGTDKVVKSNLDIGVSSLSQEERQQILELLGLPERNWGQINPTPV